MKRNVSYCLALAFLPCGLYRYTYPMKTEKMAVSVFFLLVLGPYSNALSLDSPAAAADDTLLGLAMTSFHPTSPNTAIVPIML